MRTYVLEIFNGRKYSTFPGVVLYTPARIHQAVIEIFRETFGREPAFHWHKDGFMAEAYMFEENLTESPMVQLQQVNHKEVNTTSCWIMHGGVPHPYVHTSRQLKEDA